MKNTFVKTLILAGLTLSPMMVSAQGKGSTETVPGVTGQPQPEGKTGKNNDDEDKKAKNMRKGNNDLFTRLDADASGSLSREEFAKMADMRKRNPQARRDDEKTRPNKDREDRKPADADTTAPATGTEIKDPAGTSGAPVTPTPATGTTGSTGGTGSSASSSGANGSAASGTGTRPQ